MAPRRPNHARPNTKSYATSISTSIPSTISPAKQSPMPPSSRYLHNLRVIQRHDPTITALFDQFPHVCVYHHKGDEWQKKGCEGAMFLFEREVEPKYGFYILNRNNTGDYIQRMTPDDDVEFASAYLIYRAFGKVTSDTIGLWTMVTQDREAMSQVMMRLHSYIKRGERYPNEFRRRPDTWATTPAPARAQVYSIKSSSSSSQTDLSTSNSISALSNLLAKLESASDPSGAPLSPDRSVSASVPPATGIPLLDTIFASASLPEPTSPLPPPPAPAPNTLHALLGNGLLTQPLSLSPSCEPTPTQHLLELPITHPPHKSRFAPVNGTNAGSHGRSVFPNLNGHGAARNGRETAPPIVGPSLATKPTRNGVGSSRRRHSAQHAVIPDTTREEDERNWEDEARATPSVDANDDDMFTTSPRRSRNGRKREREREKRRVAYQNGAVNGGAVKGAGQEGAHNWRLVDDRSLSVDDEGEVSGLGDGLIDALAAVSGSDIHQPEYGPPRKSASGRGRDRRKRKHKADRPMPQGASSSSTPPPVEIRNALLEAYGNRRRVGDPVLTKQDLVAEVLHLINNDPKFVQEFHQLYLRKV